MEMAEKRYGQMTLAVREEISRGLAAGLKQGVIALGVGYTTSAVGREIRRHSVADIGYRAHWAHERANDAARRKGRRRKLSEGPLWDETCRQLKSGLSPEQVAKALKRDFADNAAMHVSHETIYQALYVLPRNALKAVLVAEGLRQHHEKRRPHSKLTKAEPKVRFSGVSIDERPAEVDTRTVPGHWEGDLIKGEKNRSEVGVLLERQSRRVVLARLTDARAVTVREAFEAAFRLTPPGLLRTLTYDQGSEMAEHATLAANANINIYFADAHSPWQKGAIENANGLLRQYLPKGTNLANHTQAQLDVIAEKLNNRLRECLDWKTPNEVWAEMIKKTLH
ncbi:MAG: IS30 family transposase [Thermomonas sp.]